MVVRILGIQSVDFVNALGEQIQGNNIFVSYPTENQNLVGEKVEKFFVRQEIPFPEQMKIGEQINISFNNKGKVEQITKK